MSATLAKAKEQERINGVDVGALFATIDAIKKEPRIAAFNFRLKNTWMSGDRNRSTIGAFTGALAEQRTEKAFSFENGEHAVLLGEDHAPNPVEWLLHALIGCMTTTTAYHAAARGVTIDAIDSAVDGDLDLRGFLGLADVRKGYQKIRVKMRVKTRATKEAIADLVSMSPVYDVVSKSVPVDVAIETY